MGKIIVISDSIKGDTEFQLEENFHKKIGNHVISVGKIKVRKRIIDMEVGESGYCVSWAVGNWNWLPYPEHLNGLNLRYPVYPKRFRTSDTIIQKTESGWVIDGKSYLIPEKEK